LARAGSLPRTEDVESPSAAGPGEVRVYATASVGRLPSGFRTGAEDSGAIVLEVEEDRVDLVRRLLGRVDPGASIREGSEAGAIARDFLALGTARWMVRDLTIGMGHADYLDAESLAREVLAGARAWEGGDDNTARNRLRAAFELLTQARERFYSV